MGNRVYAGASARTRKGQVVFSCPCGERFRTDVWHSVDTNSPGAVDQLCDGTLNRVRCPSCGASADVQVPVLFHDLAAPRLTLVLPEGLRHRELAERARLFEALAADLEPPPLYVLEPEVVFGAAGLRASLAPRPTTGDFSVATPAAPLPTAATHPPLGDTEQTPISDVATRLRVTVPDPRQSVIERWIASREGPATFLVEDAVLACAALPPDPLENFLGGPIELRVQLHRLPNYPIVTLTMLAGKGDAVRVEDGRVLCVALDVARAAHRVVLEALGRKTRLTLELYDHEYLPVVAHAISTSLEENVRRIIGEARDALERLAPATRSFDRARGQLMSPKYDRLGRTDVDLPNDLDTLEKPSAIRAALSAVVRWSEPSAEAYLVEIRGMSLPVWRATRARVIRRALDAGIAVRRQVVERSAKEHMAPLPSWPELLEIGVKRFAEVASGQRPNDLTAVEEAENWEHLLKECGEAGVIVDDTVRSLASSAARRARAAATGAGVDLRSLDSVELVALLERKELRREAALILCERHDAAQLPAVFSAVRRMARAEANVVLPAVTNFGEPAEKWLVEGLRSKKSFMRQGCALGLGALKTARGVEALVHLLVEEPTEIWGEVARAIGDAGPMAVMPLAAQLREADTKKNSEARDRLVQALAHLAARPGTQSRSPVEMLAEARDPQVAAAAQRALDIIDDVQRDDQLVRRGSGTTEVTVVRGFSRRFYEALSGPIELSAADLEEIDEELDPDPDGDDLGAVGPDRDPSGDGDSDDDHDLRTATDLQALGPSTAPHQRSTLPRDRS